MVATDKVMVLHEELKTETFTWHTYLVSLNLVTYGFKSLRDLKNNFMGKLIN
jgi:hypothetical protein